MAASALSRASVLAGLRRQAVREAPIMAAYLDGSSIPFRTFAAPAKKAAAAAAKKRKKAWTIKRRAGHAYSLDASLHLVKSMATAKFDELGVDPRKPGQAIRGVVQLPHGTGKSVRVAVFARGVKADEAKAAGADIVGAEDLVEAIQKGELNFDKAVASPDMMALVGRVARVLGPRGLMPNPKLGTVTPDVAAAVQAAKAGQVEYRVERNGIIHASVGKVSFAHSALRDNLRAFMLAILAAKPESLKGHYLRHVTLCSSQGKGVNVAMGMLDPGKGAFMQVTDDVLREIVQAAGGEVATEER